MKQFLAVVLCLLVMLSPIMSSPAMADTAIDITNLMGYPVDPAFQPKGGSIVVDAATAQIIWAEDIHKPWAPASLTKLMVLYLAYQAIDRGEFDEQTMVRVTPEISQLSAYTELSNNWMPVDAEYSVSELIDLLIIPSSAAGTMLLVYQMGLTHGEIVDLMNQTAKDLNMKQTHFHNAIGAPNAVLGPFLPEGKPPEGDNQSNAHDFAILSSQLVKEFPRVLNHSSKLTTVVRPGTALEDSFTTFNYSLQGAAYGLEGLDGLKTGSSGPAAYNFTTTAQRGDTRLVEVVLGVGDWFIKESETVRSLIGNSLLEKAFREYEYRLVLPKGEHTINGQTIVTEDDFYDTVPKNQDITFDLQPSNPGPDTGRLIVDLEREYLAGYQAPNVAYQVVTEPEPEPIIPEPEMPETSEQSIADPSDPPEDAGNTGVKRSIFTLSLYLAALLIPLFLLRTLVLRFLRQRLKSDKRKKRR